MIATNTDNQALKLKEKIKKFFIAVVSLRIEGICPVRNVLAVSLEKWSLFCIYNLGFNDVMRFNERKQRIPDVSSRMLSITLKRLEEQGIVERKAYAEVPPRVEYQLSTFGQEYAEKLIDLSSWFMDRHPTMKRS
jgi:DNA-binding HxlR family transcriptional regulator